MKIWMGSAILLLLIVGSAPAQDFDRYFSLSWQGSIPLSNTSWIDKSSGKGLRIGYRKMINNKFAAGFDYTWATYDQYFPPTTFESGNSAIHTDYFNYVYSYAITLSGQYFVPLQTKKIMPFAGLGAGASMNRYVQYYNIYKENDSSWGFIARPEIGVLFPFGGKWGATVSGNYNFSTAKSDYFGYDNFNYFGVNVGVVIMSY
jgi:Outer membrane protein beta-barrel domain